MVVPSLKVTISVARDAKLLVLCTLSDVRIWAVRKLEKRSYSSLPFLSPLYGDYDCVTTAP